MKNKLLIFLSAIIFAVPFVSHAIPLPMANVSVIVNTVGSDSTFHFDLQKNTGSVWVDIQQFDLQTQNLTATKAPINIPSYIQLRITEQGLPGLKANVRCVGDHNNATFSYGNGVVDFSAVTTVENIVCTFNNIKAQNPVLIVPGLTGTELMEGSVLLWADVIRMVDPFNSDSFMDPLQFNKDLTPTNADITLGGVIRSKPLFDYTNSLINTFVNQEGYVENSTLFTFPYDWRYGVTGRLGDGQTVPDKLGQKIQSIMQQTGSDKVDVIAHSMGGLIVKKYVMDHPSDNHIGKAVFVGVPNTGAPKTVKILVQGDNLDIPGLSDAEIKKISENMPAVYDLFPSQKYYDVKGSFISKVDIGNGTGILSEKDLNYQESQNYLNQEKNFNSQALANSESLHTQTFDDFDLRTAGIDLYAIDGCKSGTLTNFVEVKYKDIFGNYQTSYDRIDFKPGDKTVPLESATNLPINQANKFYALVSDHGKMLSEDGIMQKIVNLISGSNLGTKDIWGNDLITQDISQCQLNGQAISVFSPVDLSITDQNGNKIGFADDGSLINEIPNADFEVWGEHKFVYLPKDNGQTYNINMQGTGNGTFTIINQNIQGGAGAGSEVFSNIPVTADLTGQMDVNNPTTTLTIKPTSDSDPITIQPSANINGDQSDDLLPPTTTPTISGTVGQPGFYSTDVSVNLKTVDAVISGQENQTSGVLAVNYNLDNVGYQKFVGDSKDVAVSVEGKHTLEFFATDNAGNNEQEQTITFSIDKIAPAINVKTPTDKANYTINQNILADWSASDELSGIASSTGTVASGSAIDTATTGAKSFTVTVTDNAGNVSKTAINYNVLPPPDATPPVITATITPGTNSNGWNNSNVSVSWSVADPESAITSKSGCDTTTLSNETSGTTITCTAISQGGTNSKSITIKIDKTAPEAVIQFDPSAKDIKFSGKDNMADSSSIAVSDKDDVITLTDQAGNITEFDLKSKNRKITMAAEIKAIKYNGVPADISKNSMIFGWLYNKKGNLTLLSQYVASKKDYNILALSDGKDTLLMGKDSSGKILKTLSGVQILKITTSKGDLGWSY